MTVAVLVIVGLPGTGKTTVAKEISSKLGCGFLDTDDIVASSVGCPVAEYLRTEGEAAFREAECRALEEALDADAIVATGGGIVTTPRARQVLASQRTFWLDCGDDEILARVDDGDRPLLGDKPRSSLARLRAQREQWYREVSCVCIDASGTLDQVVERVLKEAQKVER